ncbi:MAG: tetratricopeptide repeat protein, partial [Leadbetterella sp.]|nr:tetratricopeptide repeat protein [Leadbetterella sp.]
MNRPYHERLEVIDRLHRLVSDTLTPVRQVTDTLAGLRQLATRTGDRELLLEADLLEVDYVLATRPGEAMDKLLRTLERAEEESMTPIACRVIWRIGQYYWAQAQYEQGFRWYLRLDHLLQGMDVEKFPDKANYLEEIGRAYYRFGDYEKAIPYFKQVAALPVRDYYRNRWLHALNTMGLTYRELARWEESDACFDRLLEETAGQPDQWTGIASGNLGQNLYLRGSFEKAVPLLQTDIRIAEKYEDWGLAAGSAIPMADILTQNGRLEEAKTYID